MADLFAPKLQSDVAYERPVEQPSMLGALAGLGGDFLQSYSASQRSSSAGSTKIDPQLGTFAKGLERVEAIRNEKGEQAALIAERQLATNFAMQGIEFDTDYQNVYTKTTGRQWAGYGRDNEDFMREQALQDPQVQASYVASYAMLPQDSTDEQRIEYALGQKATLQASADVIARSRAEQGYKWSVQTEAAYGTAIDTFLNTNLGSLVATQQQGGRVGPQSLANLTASWDQLKVNVSRPSGVTDDQWKSTQDKISSIDNLLSTLTKVSSSDVLFEEITTALADALITEGEGSTTSLLAAMTAIKDPASLSLLAGAGVNTFIMDVGKSINLDVTQPQLFGHIAEQAGLGVTPGGNITLDELPPIVASRVENLSPLQYVGGLKASGQFTKLTDASSLQRPEGRQQFVENSVGIGAVLMSMSNDDFLSASFLKELVGNPKFIQNIKTLDGVDPEGGTVVRTYVRSGLNIEMVRQQRNLAAIDATSVATWNGTNYVIDQDQLRMKAAAPRIEGFNRSLQKYYGGDIVAGIRDGFRGVIGDGYADVIQSAGLYNLEGAMDRRDAIGVINDTLKGLAVEDTGASTQEQSNQVQSTTASLIASYESGRGGYDTLFNQAQGSGGPFEGFNVSQKTLGELYEFSNPSGAQGTYGAYVKATNPKEVLATPMGRYQFVGSTLKSVAKDMGLPDDTVFNKETQDSMFLFLARDVIKGKSQEGKRSALRSTWAGFNQASNADLDKMIAEVEGGNVNLGDVSGSTREYTPAVTTSELPPATTEGTISAPVSQAPVVGGQGVAPVESVQATAELPPEATQAVTPQSLPTVSQSINISNDLQTFLKSLGANPDQTFAVNSLDELDAAQSAGRLKKGDKVLVGQGAEAFVVEIE